jgi:hypothetical protein
MVEEFRQQSFHPIIMLQHVEGVTEERLIVPVNV